MQFFDEDTTPERPPRHARQPPEREQAVLIRRLVGAGIILLLLILVVFGIRGCIGARKDRNIKNYVNKVSELVKESDAVGEQLFDLLKKPGKATALDVQEDVNTLRASTEKILDRAERIDPPGGLDEADHWLISALEFRRDALRGIAQDIPAAFAEQGRQRAFERIAGQMQNFLTSDVMYSQRFTPLVLRQLKKRDLVNEVTLPESHVLPDLSWLESDTIGSRLGSVKGGKKATPGTHGTGLLSVTAQPSGTTLTEGSTTTLQTTAKLTFDIEVENQGENEEADVIVTFKLSGTTSARLEQIIPQINPKEKKTVSIPLGKKPTVGTATLSIAIKPVPGEQTTENNKAKYLLSFEG